jgi:hypothetical protein
MAALCSRKRKKIPQCLDSPPFWKEIHHLLTPFCTRGSGDILANVDFHGVECCIRINRLLISKTSLQQHPNFITQSKCSRHGCTFHCFFTTFHDSRVHATPISKISFDNQSTIDKTPVCCVPSPQSSAFRAMCQCRCGF